MKTKATIRLRRFRHSRRREEGEGEGDGRARPTTMKGSWEGSAVFLLGVTASFLIKDRIGYNRVKNSIIVHGILHDLA